jgi:hypothetical protein
MMSRRLIDPDSLYPRSLKARHANIGLLEIPWKSRERRDIEFLEVMIKDSGLWVKVICIFMM